MDADEPLPLRSETPIAQLVREDLDRLSVAELHARVATLDGEIVRTRAKIASAVNHRGKRPCVIQIMTLAHRPATRLTGTPPPMRSPQRLMRGLPMPTYRERGRACVACPLE